MQMQITTGKIQSAQKIVVYGPEGIGKSTFASQFPRPLFIDTEGSTKHMDVARTPKPSSWSMLLEQVRHIKANPQLCGTLIIDTADWAEQLCTADVCGKAKKSGIEEFGFGKGYVYLAEEFGRFLNLLEEVIEVGINVVLTAHAKMRKFEQPDEMGAYDRWEMKLGKNTAPLVKEWADMVLFANYKTYVVNVDGQGSEKGKNKAQGGSRVMYSTHHPCWDAKNRHDLKPELAFSYSEIAYAVEQNPSLAPVQQAQPSASPPTAPAPIPEPAAPVAPPEPSAPVHTYEPPTKLPQIPKELADLMEANLVTEFEIQSVVAKKGYYTIDTAIENYDPNFIRGVLVSAWPQVFQMIRDHRASDLPF